MLDPRIDEYIHLHSSPEPALLYELRRRTHLQTVYPRMLSGPVQGRFLEMISRMIRPQRILEIGTFTGYSAICLAQGLAEGGILHTIEAEAMYADMAIEFFSRAGLKEKIILHEGDALQIIPSLDESFDLVFIDAAKEHYCDYYDLVFDKLRKGGFILADNTLWDGKVLEEEGKGDPETRGIVAFNKLVQEDERVENVMLSVRDGIMLIRKN
jgi:predicted O-methyltransferase YrrM